jgi:GNAT superfamily N-acetyltransferase
MSDYRIRLATLDDEAILVYQRIAMFEEMGVMLDKPALTARFGAWLRETIPAGTYRAWLVESASASVVAGGGMTIIPWPPGPTYPGDKLAFVYNVFTEPPHRNQGLAKLVMHAMHGYCRDHGIGSIALNASVFGRPLYESLGYAVTPSPMMFLALE